MDLLAYIEENNEWRNIRGVNMKYSIIFDGPNFIANAIDIIGDMDDFSDRFSLGGFCNKLVQGRLHHIFHAEAKSLGLEFFYSDKVFG